MRDVPAISQNGHTVETRTRHILGYIAIHQADDTPTFGKDCFLMRDVAAPIGDSD